MNSSNTNSTVAIKRWLLPPTLLLVIAIIVSFVFIPLPTSVAVNPPPDGGYPNGNTAEGDNALLNLTSGSQNTALGAAALGSNTTGGQNTATGFDALILNGVGNGNTATGFQALFSNTSASFNTAIGDQALNKNTIGLSNTATGFDALLNNTTGSDNTATGVVALMSNTTGRNNSAMGFAALDRNTTGSDNIAVGDAALSSNTTGSNNVAVGFAAGGNLTTGSNNIDIGANVLGLAREANTIRIGKSGTQQKTFIAGISGKTVPSGAGVIISSNGQLGTIQSSARFKEAIKPMDKASETILALKPVTFRYKEDLDPDRIPQFGLIAEDVEKVNPNLVVRDEDGKVSTVRYDAVNAMLLNEFLKEHRKVKALETTVTREQKQIDALTAGLQKVSERIELNKPAPRLVER